MSTFIMDRRASEVARALLPDVASVEVLDLSGDGRGAAGLVIDRPVLAGIALRGQAAGLRAALDGGPFAKIQIIEIDPRQPQAGASALTRLLFDEVQTLRRHLGEARLTAAQLRAEGQGATTRLREIENLLHGLGNPQVSNALTWQPAGKMLVLSGGQSLAQLLPISAVSVSAVDLWFPQVVMPQVEDLSVAIEDASGRVYPLFASPPEMGLETGWLRFVLPEPIAGHGCDCRLRIGWRAEGQIVLGLGQPVADPRFRAAPTPGVAREETLALRVWRALAGVRLPASAPVLSGGVAASIREAHFVLPSALPKPELLARPPHALDHVSTAFWGKEDAILVHPSRAGTTCAIIRDVALPGLSHVSALVTPGHGRTPNLNFAIGVAPHGEVDEDGLWQRRLGPWVTGMPAHSWGQAHCIPAAPISGRADLLLAASLAVDVPNDFSWGLFRGFRFSFDGSAGDGQA